MNASTEKAQAEGSAPDRAEAKAGEKRNAGRLKFRPGPERLKWPPQNREER